MDVNLNQHPARRWVILLTGFSVFVVALILFARVALDVVLVLAICTGLFLFQRTAGDWLNEALGASVGTLIFASVTATFLWFLLMTGGGKSFAERFLAVADRRGFHTVFLERQIIPPSSVHRLPSPAEAQSATPQPTETSEVSNPAPVETASGGSDASGARAAAAEKNKTSTVPTQVALELTQTRAKVGERVVATATIRAGGEPVDDGAILFTVNGLSRSVPVRGGIATVDLVEMLTGRCEVRAEYQGTSRFAPASAAPAVLIIE
jgi:hypothetical protein